MLMKKHLVLLILLGIIASAMLAVTVSGIVCGSDAPTIGLANATIILDGESDYTAVTNTQGYFIIPNVAGNSIYQYAVSYPDYQTATGSINIGNVDYNMGTITLNWVADPPTNVQAVANANLTATISWEIVEFPAGYKVWRLLPGQENNEPLWTLLTPSTIYEPSFIDTGWNNTVNTRWAVKAVYIGNVLSEAAFSNPLPANVISISGQVRGNDHPDVGLADATVVLDGTLDYTATTDAEGMYSIHGVQNNTAYQYTISHPGYISISGALTVGVSNVEMETVTLDENYAPVQNVQAAENAGHTAVNVIWTSPLAGPGEWIHWDSGENNDSIGNGGVADFDIASRWTASDLNAYEGLSLFAVKFYPAQTASFSIRVWTGGNGFNSGTMIIDQPVENPTLYNFNTVILDTPVPIPANQELWFGVRVIATSGYPAGCDAGPAHDGLGNMIYWQGAWITLLSLAPTLNFDWNLAGFVGNSEPPRITHLTPLPDNPVRISGGVLSTGGRSVHLQTTSVSQERTASRSLLGYRVWRLFEGQENNETLWALLTPNLITATNYSDGSWNGIGIPKWAVKAYYTGNNASPSAFSNPIVGAEFGTVTGYVRNALNNQPIAGAAIHLGNVYAATTDQNGLYIFNLVFGYFDITASATGFRDLTVTDVHVITNQTTIVNFFLLPVSGNQDNVLTPTCLLGCYPNPFHSQTTLSYSLAKTNPVTILIYNQKGQRIRTLISQPELIGNHSIVWDGCNDRGISVAAGIYLYRMTAGQYKATGKLLRLE